MKNQIIKSILLLIFMSSLYLSADSLPIKSKSSNIGSVSETERSTNIYYHNNRADLLWCGTDQWATHFELSKTHGLTNFIVQGARIYFPQAVGECYVSLYSDVYQPLDSLLVKTNSISVEQGWNDIALPANNQFEGDNFWIVLEYETDETSRQIASSSTGGKHSYYWVPSDGKNIGYFANMLESDIESELLINLVGEVGGDGYDLELVDFLLEGNLQPGGSVMPVLEIRNNSNKQVKELVGVQIQLHCSADQTPMDVTIPYQLDLKEREQIVAPLIGYGLSLNALPAQYIFTVTILSEDDDYTYNNQLEKRFDNFIIRRQTVTIENFVRLDDQASLDVIDDQINTSNDPKTPYYTLNYFFNPTDTLYYSPEAASHKGFYGVAGYPLTVIDGTNQVVGHTDDYIDILMDMLSDVDSNKTFITPLESSIKKEIEPTKRILSFGCRLQNANTYVFSETLSNLRVFAALIENELDGIPGGVLRYIEAPPFTGSDLRFRGYSELEWSLNLHHINSAVREIIPENYSDFDLAIWVQDSDTKRVYYFDYYTLDEFSLTSSVDEQFSYNVSIPNLKVFPNPSYKQSMISFQLQKREMIEEGKVVIYNIKGQKVKSIVLNMTDREESIYWDGRDRFGAEVKNGVYLIRSEFKLHNGSRVEDTQKVIIAR